MAIMGETLIVDEANRTATGRVLPVGVFITKAATTCDLCGGSIPEGTPVLRATALRNGAMVCPSCIHQANATLMREWEDRHPESDLSTLTPCPRCLSHNVEVHVATAHKTTYHLLGDGDYEEADGENFLEADRTVFVKCSTCDYEYWAREAYWPLLG